MGSAKIFQTKRVHKFFKNLFLENAAFFTRFFVIRMVCEKCEEKVGKVSKIATPNPWKASNNSKDSASSSCGRQVNENKILSSKKARSARINPLEVEFKKCRICRTKVHSSGHNFCQECAYKKGICGRCGVKILKTKNYKQS